MAELHYWFSGAALVFPLSFVITVILGIILLMDGKSSKPIVFGLLFAALVITGIGWHAAADQEQKNDQQSEKLDAAQDSLKVVRGQLADLIVNMNRAIASTQPPELALLAPDAPEWVKIAYKELNQKEIPGPQENSRIVEYFKSVGAKKDYRDDIDDWHQPLSNGR
jgi:hypothetical protein